MAVKQRPAVIPLASASDFPPELVADAVRNWTAYDLEACDDGFTKMPISPHNGRRAKSNDPTTWGTFAEAHAFAARRGLGVMFMIAPPFFGFDMDDCIEDGVISPLATSVLGELHTFAEISVSGAGIKGVGIGTKSGTRCRRKGLKLEIYDRVRPFALTGQRLPDAPLAINDCQEGLDFIYGAAFGDERDAPAVAWDPAAVSNDDDQAIIDWLHDYKNGARFAAYWGGQDGGDPSGGDQGMANMIAWRTGPEPTRIEGIFNASARAGRAKWQQRPAYRASTIRKAIDSCNGRFYEARPLPRLIAHPTVDEKRSSSADDESPTEARLRERVESLERENAEWRQRYAKAQKMLADVMQIRRNTHIKAERDTLTACVLHIAAERANGRADEAGWVRQPAQTVADTAGKGVAAARTHLTRAEEWGIIERKLVEEFDEKHGQRRTVYYARTTDEPESILGSLLTLNPERDTKSWGGKREPCPRCGSPRRRTVVTCADCQLEFSDKITAPAPEDNTVADVSERADEPASIPPTPVEELAADPLVAVRDDQHDEADDWDPHFCNHIDHCGQQCTARIDPALGKRYCWQHRQAPIEPSPVPHGAVAFTLGGVRYGPPKAEAPPLDPAVAEGIARRHDGQAIAARLSGFQARWDGGEQTEALVLLVAEWRQIAAARRALDADYARAAGAD